MLDPISPEEAVQSYLDSRTDLSQSSFENHMYRLQRFKEWCDEVGMKNMNEITGRKLHQYKVWRAEDVNNVTLKNQLGTVRLFLRFCEDIEGVPSGVSEKLELPELGVADEVNDTVITEKEATAIRIHLGKYEYAGLRHVIFEVLWHTGIRTSTLQAFDVDDFCPDEGYIEAVHRPETGTLLKNRVRSEREINLGDDTAEVIDDWIETNHPRVEDGNDRMPLIATKQGRAHKTTIRDHIYRVTRPCYYLRSCPHDRDIDDCDAAYSKQASKCPSSVSPHAIRKGAITLHRNNGWPAKAVSDRVDVSQEVLDKHYDKGTKSQKRERRKEFLSKL